jgi:hypothetical protein
MGFLERISDKSEESLKAATITHASSHFFLRLLHVKHPVLTRVILVFMGRFRSTFGRLREDASRSDAIPATIFDGQ